MTALLASPAAPASLPDAFLDAPLFQLQIRVARRADELARQAVPDREADVRFWQQAEREVFLAAEAPLVAPVQTAAQEATGAGTCARLA